MAYVEVYYAQWDDHTDTTHEIKLLQEGGSGTTLISKLQNPPYTHKVRGGKTSPIKAQIYGSEITFNFFVAEADLTTFDAIFESDYKEWKVEHYYNSVLDFTSWLQPQNFNRDYVHEGGYYPFSLSAVDGLANLKNVEYTNASDGSQYEDRVSLITTIKRALEHVGHELDFRIQLATWCTNDSLMLSTECALDKVTCDSRRFRKTKDGRTVNTNCYEVISEILEPFSAHLIQSQGKYWIINPRDGALAGFYFPIDWTTLAVSARVGSDLRVDIISAELYRDRGQFERITPLESVGVSFRDRNIGDTLLNNGDFASGVNTEWFEGSDLHLFDVVAFGPDYELQAKVDVAAVGVPASPPPNFYSKALTIELRGEADKLNVTFNIRCAGLTMDAAFVGPDYVKKVDVTCQLRKTTSGGTIIAATTATPIQIGETESAYRLYTYSFDLTEDDDYFVEFLINPTTGLWSEYDDVDLRFDNYSIPIKYSDGDDITFDRHYKIINTDSVYIKNEDIELNFGDSISDSDIASFKIGATRTETWSRVLLTDNLSIQLLAGQNIIENYAKYKDYLRLTIFDNTDRILPHILISLGSPNYEIVSQQSIFKRHAQKEIKVELVEFLQDTVTTSIVETGLSSVDGDSSSSVAFSDAVNNPSGDPTNVGVTDHGALTGLLDPDHPTYALWTDLPQTNTWFVNPSASGGTGSAQEPYTVDEAMASATAGDVIFFQKGTYTDDISVSKNLHFVGHSREACTIDVTSFVFDTAAGIVTLSLDNFTIDITNSVTQGANNAYLTFGNVWGGCDNDIILERVLFAASNFGASNITTGSYTTVFHSSVGCTIFTVDGTSRFDHSKINADVLATGRTLFFETCKVEGDVTCANLTYNNTVIIGVKVGTSSTTVNNQASSFVNFGTEAIKTLSSGVAASSTDRNLIIAAETGTADDMIELTGLTVGDKVLLRADTGDTITVKHNDIGATIKIHLQNDLDFILDEQHAIELVLLDTNELAEVTNKSIAASRDVTITSIVTGEILKWDGTAWINQELPEAGIEPSLGNPGTNGFVLASTAGGTRSWINAAVNSILSDLADVNYSSQAAGDILRWGGSSWQNATLAASGIEPALGDPSNDGYILSSTIAGARSWVPVATAGSPASNATGTAGETRYDSTYFYVCYATDTWGRIALTTGY